MFKLKPVEENCNDADKLSFDLREFKEDCSVDGKFSFELKETSSGGGVVFVYDSAGNLLKAVTAPGSYKVADVLIQLKDSLGVDIGPIQNFLAESTGSITAPDGTAILQNSIGTLIGNFLIRSNGFALLIAPDATVLLNTFPFLSVPSTNAVNIELVDPFNDIPNYTVVGSKIELTDFDGLPEINMQLQFIGESGIFAW